MSPMIDSVLAEPFVAVASRFHHPLVSAPLRFLLTFVKTKSASGGIDADGVNGDGSGSVED